MRECERRRDGEEGPGSKVSLPGTVVSTTKAIPTTITPTICREGVDGRTPRTIEDRVRRIMPSIVVWIWHRVGIATGMVVPIVTLIGRAKMVTVPSTSQSPRQENSGLSLSCISHKKQGKHAEDDGYTSHSHAPQKTTGKLKPLSKTTATKHDSPPEKVIAYHMKIGGNQGAKCYIALLWIFG
ncbi:MAG: hypothetical protein FJY91_00505 [Candidatus Harrisonbacteria bacterium]|nr:hypothetical protein [Candidatus Harrisonbacteria bacterium]